MENSEKLVCDNCGNAEGNRKFCPRCGAMFLAMMNDEDKYLLERKEEKKKSMG